MKWLGLIFLIGLVSCSRSEKPVRAAKDAVLAPVIAGASVDKALISTEDAVTFSVVINRDSAIQVPIPDIGGLIKGFRITDFGTEDKDEDKRKVTRKWFSLRADVAGSYILPAVEVHYSEGGKEKLAKTSEIFVEVQVPSIADSGAQEGIRDDIRDIKALEKTPSHFLAMLVGTALAVIAVALGVFLYRRRKPKALDIERSPPHEEALKRLDELVLPNGSDAIALKRYYFSLSEIIRSYVEDRYGFRATDMTSEEIIRSLRSNFSFPEAQKPTFIEFLKETDIVKFTDFYPANEAITTAKERVRNFVFQTKFVVAETESVV